MWSELASGGRVSHDDKASGDDRKITRSMRELEQWVGEVANNLCKTEARSNRMQFRKQRVSIV